MPSTNTKTISLLGSSIFEFWGTPTWPNCRVINEAIRSTQTTDWLNKDLRQLKAATHRFVYCGSNDLIYGQFQGDIIANAQSLLEELEQAHPNTKLVFFSILKCPQKAAAQQLNIIDEINDTLKEFCNNRYGFIDFNQLIENDKRWYLEDGLHLNDAAYSHLEQALAKIINRW